MKTGPRISDEWDAMSTDVRWTAVCSALHGMEEDGRGPSTTMWDELRPSWMPKYQTVAASFGDGSWRLVIERAGLLAREQQWAQNWNTEKREAAIMADFIAKVANGQSTVESALPLGERREERFWHTQRLAWVRCRRWVVR